MGVSGECQALINLLASSGLQHVVTSINTGIHATDGYHFKLGTNAKGLAVDFAAVFGAGNNDPRLVAIFNALLPYERSLAELFCAVPPIKFNIKHGRRVELVDPAHHHDHVHVAVERGVFLQPAKQEAVMHLNKPICAIVDTPTKNGYWLVAGDGGVFAYGDAEQFPNNSLPSKKLNASIVSAACSPSGKGLWLAAADGGVFTLGDAVFHGSAVA